MLFRSEYTQVLLPNGVKRALTMSEKRGEVPLESGSKIFRLDNLTSQSRSETTYFEYTWADLPPASRTKLM